LIDVSRRPGEEERMTVDFLKGVKVPIIAGFNKIDVGDRFIPEYIRLWEEVKARPVTELADSLILLPLSGLKGTHLEKLLEILFSLLPEGPSLYPKDFPSTDTPEERFASEVIREKLFQYLKEDVPHCTAVLIEEIAERPDNYLFISARIIVERPSQKGIVIGKGAQALKKSGMLARQELEEYFSRKVYLDIRVQVQPHWRQDLRVMRRLGYVE
jgi:GTP-binding protein Era